MSYRKLEIWQLAREVSIAIHFLSLDLPKYELFETGSQIMHSSKSVRSDIVEGFVRRLYKQEFIRFLTFARHQMMKQLITWKRSLKPGR